MKAVFGVRVRQVTDLAVTDPGHPEGQPRYRVKAESDPSVLDNEDTRRASIHFSLMQETGVPRVGSVMVVAVDSEDEI